MPIITSDQLEKMAIPACVALPRENNALPKSAGKNASLKQKRNFEPSPHRVWEVLHASA
jgi:hypothetical protein